MKKQKVLISENLKESLSSVLQSLQYDKVFILTDNHTQTHCLPLIKDLEQIKNAQTICIQAGDIHKNIDQLQLIWKELSEKEASRNSLLINLGGGMITDIGGFAGATFKRGIQTLNIPTTLMAAVDAAVGGKTGINFNGLKNEIGSFYPPKQVIINGVFLQTLDVPNILSGYAEILKHGLIDSKDTYSKLLSFDPYKIQFDWLNRQVADSVSIKEAIVEQDPTEKGIRKALNLGHTVGHAFESLSFTKGNPLLHGYAVAIGIVCELYLSYIHKGFPLEMLTKTVSFIKEYYTVFTFDCNDYEHLYTLMLHDKKNTGGDINFTLLAEVGKVEIDQKVSKKDIFNSFDFYRDRFGI